MTFSKKYQTGVILPASLLLVIIVSLVGSLIYLQQKPTNFQSKAASSRIAGLTSQNATVQIKSGTDDVNEVNGRRDTSNNSQVWYGTGGSSSRSYTGLRFADISVPKGATISSAVIQIFSIGDQTVKISLRTRGNNTANSQPFGPTERFSSRPQTVSQVNTSITVLE